MMLRGFGRLRCVLALFCCQNLIAQTPAVGRNGIFNAASHTPLILAGNEIARGALVTITGVHLRLTNQAGTARISGSWGSTSLNVVSSTPTEIRARIPATIPVGPALVTVATGGQVSPSMAIRVVHSQFGIFSRNGEGFGPGRVDDLSATGRRVNSRENPAAPGQTLIISGTGLGDATRPSVEIAGIPATVMKVRRAAAPDAADEITARVPAAAPQGCFVPLQVLNAGRFPSNIVTVAIHRGAEPCSLTEAIPFAGWERTRAGLVVVARSIFRRADGTESTSDEAGATFARLPIADRMPPLFLAPPAGTCNSQVQAVTDSVPSGNPFVNLLIGGIAEEALSAGSSLTIDDGRVQQRIRPLEGAPGVYHSKFAAPGARGESSALPHFLSPAVLNVSATGAAVGNFRLTVAGPEPFTLGAPAAIARARGASIHWPPLGPARFAIVVLSFADPITFTTGSCYCVAAPGATAIQIPPAALAMFPSLDPAEGSARSSLTVVSWPVRPVRFEAAGLDHGLAVATFLQTFAVTLR